MSSTRTGGRTPDPPDDDFALDLFITFCKGLPSGRRNALLMFINILITQPWPRLAAFAKVLQPYLTATEIGQLCGVHRCTVEKCDEYRDVKHDMRDFLRALPRPDTDTTKRRRGFSNPFDPTR